MNFKEYRESKRLSPTQAARQLGTSYGNVWRWENDGVIPTRTQQLKIQDWSGGEVMPEDWSVKIEDSCK